MTMAMAVEWGIRGAVPAAVVAVVLLLLRTRDVRLEQQLWRSALVFACLVPALTLLVSLVRVSTSPAPTAAHMIAPALVAATAGTSSASAAVTAATGETPLRVAGLLWLTVSAVLLLRLVIGALGAWRLLRSSAAPTASVSTDPRVRVSRAINTPATIGSTVLLPTALTTWSVERRDAIIAHELTHVVNADFWWQLLARAYAAVCWWNPVAWVFVSRLRWLAERMSDAAALRVMPDRRAYATLLVDVAARARRESPALHVAMARPAMLRQRVEAILEQIEVRRVMGARRLMALLLPLSGASVAAITPMPRAELALTSRSQSAPAPVPIAATDSITIRLHASPDEGSRDPAVRRRVLSAPYSMNRVRFFVLNPDGSRGQTGETPTIFKLQVAVPFDVTFCAEAPGVGILAEYTFASGSSGAHSTVQCVQIFRDATRMGSRGVMRPK